MINIDENLITLATILKSKAELFVVGGYVRDSILNKRPKDIDLTSKLTVNELASALKGTSFNVNITNKTFGTAKIVVDNKAYEYTSFRKDKYVSGKHSPKEVLFISSLDEDSKRRDFTINAIYYNILKQKFVDPLNGIADLKNKKLKEINNTTLKFDGERILRLIKYSCELNLKIDNETFLHAKQYNKNVYLLSKDMLNSYRKLFTSFSFFKKIKLKRCLKQLGLAFLIKQ